MAGKFRWLPFDGKLHTNLCTLHRRFQWNSWNLCLLYDNVIVPLSLSVQGCWWGHSKSQCHRIWTGIWCLHQRYQQGTSRQVRYMLTLRLHSSLVWPVPMPPTCLPELTLFPLLSLSLFNPFLPPLPQWEAGCRDGVYKHVQQDRRSGSVWRIQDVWLWQGPRSVPLIMWQSHAHDLITDHVTITWLLGTRGASLIQSL